MMYILLLQDGGTPLPDAQMLQANPEVQGNVIEQSLDKEEVDNTEEAEVAIEMEAAKDEVDDNKGTDDKETDDVAKDQILRSECNLYLLCIIII